MDNKDVTNALGYVRSLSKKRKFDQSIEMIINFKGIDFKKSDNRIDVDVKLPHATGKQGNIKALVFVKDKAFAKDVAGKAAKVIMDSDIANIKKKEVDNLIKEYNVFLAEGPTIITVGKYLGQQLAPKGRMPKPIQADLKSFEQALKSVSTFTKVTNKTGRFMPVIHLMVGKESFKDEDITDNVMEVYSAIVNSIPGKDTNIKSVFLKTTMGKPIKLGKKYEQPIEQKAEASK